MVPEYRVAGFSHALRGCLLRKEHHGSRHFSTGRRFDHGRSRTTNQRRRARAAVRMPGRRALALDSRQQSGTDRGDGLARYRADAGAESGAAMGAGHRAAPRTLRRPARARAVLDRAVRRSRLVVGRSTHHHDELRRRTDADRRHRPGQRRRRAVLDGARRAEGRARGAGLPAGGELGRADGAARHHRPRNADRPAPRTRSHRRRTAEAHRRAIQPMGRDGLIRRNARRRHPGRAPGCDVARSTGGA